ncbi:MAG: hypothetical protein ACLFPX_08565 [Candidatus Omnitrophota bacterium]
MLTQTARAGSAVWRPVGRTQQMFSTTAAAVSPQETPLIITGTKQGIVVIDRSGQTDTAQRLNANENSTAVFEIAVHNQVFLAATSEGLWRSVKGRSWEKIFDDRTSRNGQVYSVDVSPVSRRIWIGTDHGVFYLENGQTVWRQYSQAIGNMPVYLIRHDDNGMYFVQSQAVYYLDENRHEARKVFQAGISSSAEADGSGKWDNRFIRDLRVHGSDVYLITAKGFYGKPSEGSWQRIETYGLPLSGVNHFKAVELSPPHHGKKAPDNRLTRPCAGPGPLFLAATDQGFYASCGKDWQAYVSGLSTTQLYDLAVSSDTVYAAGDAGLYQIALADIFTTLSKKEIALQPDDPLLTCEPAIRDVQQIAVRYADVHPGKIQRWQKQSRFKALVPDISLGLDRSGTDLYHWDTGQNPDVLQRGEDYVDWDVSLKWDLSDMVWSSSQTSIDSRSKLNVELREDILDQVTRIYFERRRLQLRGAGPEEDDLETALRIQELTALLDGYTGGEFSERKQEMCAKQAELK